MTDPDDDYPDDFDNPIHEILEELADYNESASRSHDEGWFYSDDD